MKKITTLFLFVLSLVMFMTVTASADTPIEISSAAELMSMEMDGSYKLVADIDLTDVEFTPIGTASVPFAGEFDGNSKIISGLSFDTANTYVGLFGVCENAIIKNVVIDNLSVNISESNLSQIYVSGICALAKGNCSFASCTVKGSIAVKSRGGVYASGICAYFKSEIGVMPSSFASCKNNASISAESTGDSSTVYAAGIVAYGQEANIALCANQGEITVTAKNGAIAAGISAIYGYKGIDKSYNTANITATSQFTEASAGGIISRSIYGTIEDSYNAGDISAFGSSVSYAGGLCAESQFENTYKRSYNAGLVKINESGYAGSLVGTASARDAFSNNYVIESSTPPIGKNPKDGAATSLSRTNMKLVDSFVGFDFDEVWYMPQKGDYLYPTLCGFENEEIIICGDLNGDGSINTIDYVIVSRFLADFVGYEDYVSVQNCDLNSDNSVTMIDAVILARHIANWKGYETIPLA